MPSRTSLPLSRRVSNPRYCFLDPDIRETPGLHLAYAGRETCRPDYRVRRREFPCASVELVTEGRGQVLLNGTTYPLSPGILFTYGPGVPHDITTDPSQPMVKYFAAFFGSEAELLLPRAGIPLGQTMHTLSPGSIGTLFEQLLDEGSRNQRSAAEICASYLRIILLKAVAEGGAGNPPVASTTNTFNRCRDFIDQHYSQLKSLQEIAERLNLRAPYLCRLFRQMGYPSPFQYLTYKKLARATEILVSEGKSVKEAAHDVGYADAYHFSRVFKSHYGKSPSQFVKLAVGQY